MGVYDWPADRERRQVVRRRRGPPPAVWCCLRQFRGEVPLNSTFLNSTGTWSFRVGLPILLINGGFAWAGLDTSGLWAGHWAMWFDSVPHQPKIKNCSTKWLKNLIAISFQICFLTFVSLVYVIHKQKNYNRPSEASIYTHLGFRFIFLLHSTVNKSTKAIS